VGSREAGPLNNPGQDEPLRPARVCLAGCLEGEERVLLKSESEKDAIAVDAFDLDEYWERRPGSVQAATTP
jgi:hypothetical protein